MVFLKNKNTGKSLNCFLSTINKIVDEGGKLLEYRKGCEETGQDEILHAIEITNYGNRMIIAEVKRFKNKLAVTFQLQFRENDEGINFISKV